MYSTLVIRYNLNGRGDIMFGRKIKGYFIEDNLFYTHKGKEGTIYFYTVKDFFNEYTERTYQLKKNGEYHILISEEYLNKILLSSEDFELLVPVLKNIRSKIENVFLFTFELFLLVVMFRVPLNVLYFIGLPQSFILQLLLLFVLIVIVLFPFVCFNIIHYRGRKNLVFKSELLLYGIENIEIKQRLKDRYTDKNTNFLMTRLLPLRGERVRRRIVYTCWTLIVLMFLGTPIAALAYIGDSMNVFEYLEYREGYNYNYRYKVNKTHYVYSYEKEIDTTRYLFDIQECGGYFCSNFIDELIIYNKDFSVADKLDFTEVFDLEEGWFSLKDGISYNETEILNNLEEVIEKQVYLYDIVEERSFTFTMSKEYSIHSIVKENQKVIMVGKIEEEEDKTILFEITDMNNVTEEVLHIPTIEKIELNNDSFYATLTDHSSTNRTKIVKLDRDFNIIEEFTFDTNDDRNMYVLEENVFLKFYSYENDYGYLYSLDSNLNLVNEYRIPKYKIGHHLTMSSVYTNSYAYDFTMYNSKLDITDKGLICNGCSEDFLSNWDILYQVDGDTLYAVSDKAVTVFKKDDSYHYSLEYKEKYEGKSIFSLIYILLSYGIVGIYAMKAKNDL